MSIRTIGLLLSCCLLGVLPGTARAIEFKSLECSSLPTTQAPHYNVTISCRATISRPGESGWYSAPGWDCPTFCAGAGGVNTPSPDGFSCTSGEERPWSAIGVVNYAATGCWHACAFPEGIAGAVSVGPRCYAPFQKRDNDRTDITVGCFCATGDVQSTLAEVGIHASGSAQVASVGQELFGWSSIQQHVINDKPGRLAYVLGSVPLAGVAAVSFSVNVQGACGSSFAMSGVVNGSGGSSRGSNELHFNFPGCATTCSDGVDNDSDGLVDMKDPGCSSADDVDESGPLSQCQNGADDDGDGLIDGNDPDCVVTKGTSELGEGASCSNGPQQDNTATLTSLEEIARGQRDAVHALASVIRRSQRNVNIRARVQELRIASTAAKHKLARALRKEFPKVSGVCSSCPLTDLSTQIGSFLGQSQNLHSLAEQMAALYTEPVGGAGFSKEVSDVMVSADSLFEQFTRVAAALPRATREC